jgi:heme ABC exporter ATP-binding subunit CcmA
MNDPVINVSTVSKAFETRKVLNKIDLSVSGGESVYICGINGAGKSTLLRIISGILQPDSGSVMLCGYDTAKDPEKAKPQLGVISHKAMVYPDLTVAENLKFFANLYGVDNPTRRVDELLEDVSLTPFRYDPAAILSRGLLQRLSIARALVHKPAILLADEPFTGLDSDSCKHLVSIFDEFIAKDGTIIMTTHDATVGLKCCRRVAVLDKGCFCLDELTENIDANSFADDYLGYAGRSA